MTTATQTHTVEAHWRAEPTATRPGLAWIESQTKSGTTADLYVVQKLPSGEVLLERDTPDADGEQPCYVVSDGRCTCPAGKHGRACKHTISVRILFPRA